MTFQNSGVLPILFSTVLLRGHPDPATLDLVVSYVALYLLGWSPIFWTLGYDLIAGEKNAPPAAASGAGEKKGWFSGLPPSVKRILSPPIIGSVGGLLIGATPLAKLFLTDGAVFGTVTNAGEPSPEGTVLLCLVLCACVVSLPASSPDAGQVLLVDGPARTGGVAGAAYREGAGGPGAIAGDAGGRHVLCKVHPLTHVLLGGLHGDEKDVSGLAALDLMRLRPYLEMMWVAGAFCRWWIS
jgi:hypothetical protein